MVRVLKCHRTIIDVILREWLLTASVIGLILTSLYIKQLPSYSVQEIEVLFLLFTLFIAVNGLQQSGAVARISQSMEQGRLLPLKLVVTTFVLSMVVTNDIALLVLVPLTLSFNIPRRGLLVILEALAANAGSALTPFGNPQNLFLYWFYGISPGLFIKTILPFSALFLVLLAVASLFVTVNSESTKSKRVQPVGKTAYVYGMLLSAVLLTVLHILPVYTAGILIVFAVLFDRKALRVDYALLLSFFFFFGLAENLKVVLATEISHSGHIFLFSALASQVMSNVPAALLFSKFTSNWQALLWGVNAGGFGSLFGSLANLIAYRLYVSHDSVDDRAGFTITFLLMGYAAFCISIMLYFFLYQGLPWA
jgi:Na+/H+ antiporter NhaD/arsenite permease-like protein